MLVPANCGRMYIMTKAGRLWRHGCLVSVNLLYDCRSTTSKVKAGLP